MNDSGAYSSSTQKLWHVVRESAYQVKAHVWEVYLAPCRPSLVCPMTRTRARANGPRSEAQAV